MRNLLIGALLILSTNLSASEWPKTIKVRNDCKKSEAFVSIEIIKVKRELADLEDKKAFRVYTRINGANATGAVSLLRILLTYYDKEGYPIGEGMMVVNGFRPKRTYMASDLTAFSGEFDVVSYSAQIYVKDARIFAEASSPKYDSM